MTQAHEAEINIRFIERWPDHEPREGDPNYKIFRKTRARMKEQGLLKCNVESSYHKGQIELHHDKIEFAHTNDIDVEKFERVWGIHLAMSEEEFKRYVEGPGNLEPLCALHHRGQEGIHSLPSPEWNVLRTAKEPQNVFIVQRNTGIGVVK